MATLTIRNIPDDIHKALRMKAAAKGRSMEAEVRDMIVDGVNPSAISNEERLKRLRAVQALLKKSSGDFGTVDEFLADRRAMWGERD